METASRIEENLARVIAGALSYWRVQCLAISSTARSFTILSSIHSFWIITQVKNSC